MHDKFLFQEYDWFDVRQKIKVEACGEVDQLPEAAFKKHDIAEIAAELCKKYLPILPTLEINNIKLKKRKIPSEVSRGRRQYFGNDGPHYVKGTAIDVYVPFDGDPEMFNVKPSTCSVSCLRGRVEGKFIIFTISVDALSPDKVKADINSRVADIQECLDYLSKSVSGFSDELNKIVVEALEARKSKLNADNELIAGLGFKVE